LFLIFFQGEQKNDKFFLDKCGQIANIRMPYLIKICISIVELLSIVVCQFHRPCGKEDDDEDRLI